MAGATPDLYGYFISRTCHCQSVTVSGGVGHSVNPIISSILRGIDSLPALRNFVTPPVFKKLKL